MPLKRCPRCTEYFIANPNTGDFVHDCNSTTQDIALRQEDVVIIGDWSDFSGSGTRPATQVMLAGVENELSPGASIGGNKFITLTVRGKHAATHRQRPHLQYIEKPMEL